MVTICFSRKVASTYMQYDLLGSTRGLTWPWPVCPVDVSQYALAPSSQYASMLWSRSHGLTWPWSEAKFWHWLLRSTCTCFDAFWREEHDAAKILSLAFSVHKLLAKTRLKKTLFCPFWPLYPDPLKTGQFWWHASERTVKELSSVFPRLPTCNRFPDNCTFPKKYDTPLNFDVSWPLATSKLAWAKNDWLTFECTYRELSKAFPAHSYPSVFLCMCGHFDPPPPPSHHRHQGEDGWDLHPGAG